MIWKASHKRTGTRPPDRETSLHGEVKFYGGFGGLSAAAKNQQGAHQAEQSSGGLGDYR